MQKRFYWLLLLFLVLPSLAVANREVCGSPPPEQFREENNESIKGDLASKANFLSSFVGKAELGGKIEATRKEVFSKYSDANTAYMDRYLAYMFCLVLFDPKNTQDPKDKIKAIQEFKQQQQKPQSSIDPKPQPKLSKVFEDDMIGGDINYLESVIGLARRKYKDIDDEKRYYKVDGCDLTVGVNSDSEINSLKLHVSPVCSFRWKSILPLNDDLPPPNKLHFGDVMNREDRWHIYADCLSMCGNAADRTIELRFGGSRAEGMIVTVLGAIIADDDNFAAASRLKEKITKEKGEEFAIFRGYACNYDLNKAAKGILENLRVNYIIISSLFPRLDEEDRNKKRDCSSWKSYGRK